MNSKYPALEWAVIVLALGLFIGYHGWFAAKAALCTCFGSTTPQASYGITGKGKIARVAFSHLVSTKKVRHTSRCVLQMCIIE